jgi:hypothetical protein
VWLAWGRGELHTGFWLLNLREGGHVEDLGVGGSIILEEILKKQDERASIGMI